MPWLKLTLRIERDQAEQLAEAWEELGAIAVTLEDAADQPLFETHWDKTPLWSHVRITGLFPEHTSPDELLRAVSTRFGLTETPPHEISLLGDEDWARSWMAHYKPLEVGRNLWVVPSWCTPPRPDAINLILDPGLAFGTGDHPTTALCLEWLAEQSLAGKTVLDFGCGSGILAIAAIKLGAREVHAVDVDAQALAVAQRNAVRNAIHRGLQVLSPMELPAGLKVDIVIANILYGTLVELAPEIMRRVRPGGWLVLAGLLGDEQAAEVRTHYAPGFEFAHRTRQNWILLAGRKPSGLD